MHLHAQTPSDHTAHWPTRAKGKAERSDPIDALPEHSTATRQHHVRTGKELTPQLPLMRNARVRMAPLRLSL
eukprot:1567176-Amphidinium_carterae.1